MYNGIPVFGVPGVGVVCCRRFQIFKVSMAQETVEGGGGDRILGRGEMAFYVA